MRVPTEDELAAIAAAYTLHLQRTMTKPTDTPASQSSWRFASRVGDDDAARVRSLTAGSRWRAAGRV